MPATPRIIVVGGRLISIYAVVWKYPNAPENVMPAQPAGVVLPAPTTAPPGTTNPAQSGEVR